MENCDTPGYITEKITNAALANAIPIFWGAPDAATDLNPAAFVHCKVPFSFELERPLFDKVGTAGGTAVDTAVGTEWGRL
jgi:hypothetical protein